MDRTEGEELIGAGDLTVKLYTDGSSLQSLRFIGGAVTESGTAYHVEATLQPQPMESRPQIPQAVRSAIQNGSGSTERLSRDMLQLLAAWMKYESAENVEASIGVRADCGVLTLNADYDYTRTAVSGTDIHCLSSKLHTLYFANGTVCTASGGTVSTAENQMVQAAGLISAAKELCLNGQFESREVSDKQYYTVTLSAETAERIALDLLPELEGNGIRFDESQLQVTLSDGKLSTIALSCGGSVRIVAKDVEASIQLTARFADEPAAHTIPVRVRQALLP